MDLEKLITEYRAAKSKAVSIDKKIKREERISEHFNAASGVDLEKLWRKYNECMDTAKDLLSQIKEQKSEFISADF